MMISIKKIAFLVLTLTCFHYGYAQEVKPIKFECPDSVNFRGLSVVNDKHFWMSGQHGTVCRSFDGGNSIVCMTVPGYENADFRSVYAFDQNRAIIANIGSPAKMLLTEDKGATWKEVYSNEHPDAFIDGIDFWNEQIGIAYGDAIDGKMLLLITKNGGQTWEELSSDVRPVLESGEGSFASSGTAIRCTDNGRVFIATGGKVSRLLYSDDMGESWLSVDVPVIQGLPSTGIFSFDVTNDNNWIVVGGDYNTEDGMKDHIFISNDQGVTWFPPATPTKGYREAVQVINDTDVIAVGPNGMDISNDKGLNWKSIYDVKGYHVVRKAREGNLIIIAGKGGVLYKN